MIDNKFIPIAFYIYGVIIFYGLLGARDLYNSFKYNVVKEKPKRKISNRTMLSIKFYVSFPLLFFLIYSLFENFNLLFYILFLTMIVIFWILKLTFWKKRYKEIEYGINCIKMVKSINYNSSVNRDFSIITTDDYYIYLKDSAISCLGDKYFHNFRYYMLCYYYYYFTKFTLYIIFMSLIMKILTHKYMMSIMSFYPEY